MIILAHRGVHDAQRKPNSRLALNHAVSQGFGLETDVRDHKSTVVISHDPVKRRALLFEQLCVRYAQQHSKVWLALNIKADGIAPHLMSLLKHYRIQNYFVFDMSPPEIKRYLEHGANVFTRQSEYEHKPVFYDQAKGVWMDEFDGEWITEAIVRRHVRKNKTICFVSPELHGRPHSKRWQFYRTIARDFSRATFMLCTDHPFKAERFFNE